MAYVFTIKLDDQAREAMIKIQNQIGKMTQEVERGSRSVNESFKEMGNSARDLAIRIGEVFALRELYEFGKELMHITAEFEAFQNVIKYSSRSIIDSQDNIGYLEGAIRRLHMPMREAYEGFSEMQAGLIGTGIEGAKLRRLFEGISTASTVLHLNPYNLQRTLYDLKEIGEQGLTMRVMRSMQTALPGIGEIIKETFHKSFQELEKEHVGGPAFLDKLAGGLQKHFAPGLGNAGNSLQSAINDTTNALIIMQRQMGENLRPLFIQILHDIRAAFNSDVVKWFVANIRPLVSGLITMVKLWAEYKAGIMAVKLAEEARIAVLSAMAIAQGRLTIATKEGEQSIKGFQEGVNNFKWGLFAMGIGAAIELIMKFRDANKQAQASWDEFVESKTGKSALQQGVNDFEDPMAKIAAAMKDTTLMKDKNYRDDLLLRNSDLIKSMQQNIVETIRPTMEAARPQMDSISRRFTPKEEQDDMMRGFLADSATLNRANEQVTHLKEISKQLQKMGARMPVYTATGGNNIVNGALHTVGLAGARGGLGEAKEVHIHIGTMQRVEVGTPKEIKNAAQDAVEVLIRTLNNLAYGQSRTM